MKTRAWVYGAIAFVGAVGVVNAGYLALSALQGVAPNCNFVHGCDIVAASPYSRVFGIPVSLFGVFFYATITGFSLWGLMANRSLARLLVFFTTPAFLISLYFLFLQVAVIHAYCEYCLFSLFDATVLFALSLYLARCERRAAPENPVVVQ